MANPAQVIGKLRVAVAFAQTLADALWRASLAALAVKLACYGEQRIRSMGPDAARAWTDADTARVREHIRRMVTGGEQKPFGHYYGVPVYAEDINDGKDAAIERATDPPRGN